MILCHVHVSTYPSFCACGWFLWLSRFRLERTLRVFKPLPSVCHEWPRQQSLVCVHFVEKALGPKTPASSPELRHAVSRVMVHYTTLSSGLPFPSISGKWHLWQVSLCPELKRYHWRLLVGDVSFHRSVVSSVRDQCIVLPPTPVSSSHWFSFLREIQRGGYLLSRILTCHQLTCKYFIIMMASLFVPFP